MNDTLTERQKQGEPIIEEEPTKFFKLLLLLPLVVGGLLLNAYFLLLLWHWFIVPLGVREITFWHSAGLSSLLSYLRDSWHKSQDEEKQNYQYWSRRIRAGFGELAFYFVLTWLFHLLMMRS